MKLPRSRNGQRPDAQLDRETPCCDRGDDGHLRETGTRFHDIPVLGKGNTTDGNDDHGKGDPEDVEDIACED